MFQNLKNFIVKDAISDEMVDTIYNAIKELPEDSKHIVENLGHTTYFMDFNEAFKKNIADAVQPYFDVKLKPTEIAFARYHYESGYVPKLFPHYDKFESSRITFDIQLKSTLTWPIYVEENEFILNNKDALVFSGTDQIHWRKNILLNKNDYTDMLFVHFSIDGNNELISEKQKIEREIRLNYFYDKIKITNEAIKI